MWPLLLISIYCVLIVLGSLAGGTLPRLLRLTHTRMQLMMSLVGGLMLGISIFHLLPHAVNPQVSLDRAVWWTMTGLLTMFFLIRLFQFHQHGQAVHPDSGHCCEHGHSHHGHSHATPAPLDIHLPDPRIVHPTHPDGKTELELAVLPGPAPQASHRFSWLGVTFGLALHTAIDGVALAASVAADASGNTGWQLFGLGTFLAIVLHKPLDALSITSLMSAGGWSPNAQQLVNAGFALTCPLGALLFYFGVTGSTLEPVLVGCALAFSAGVFICIALGDLLPEISFHTHDRFRYSLALMFGVALAYAIGFLEPEHAHGPGPHLHSVPQPPQGENFDEPASVTPTTRWQPAERLLVSPTTAKLNIWTLQTATHC